MASNTCFHNVEIFLVFLFMHIIVRLCDASLCQRSSSKFKVEPTDKQALRGENAVFQCSVADFNPQTQSMRWKLFPDPNTTPPTIEIYDAVSRILISNITVHSFGKHMQLYISCILEEISQHKTFCFSSRQAMMDIIYFPTQEELSCNPPFFNEVNIGETLTLICGVPRSNPAVDLSWKVLPGGKVLPPSLNDEGSLRVLTHDLFITRNLHLKIVLCEVSSEFSFPGKKLQCHIGPIKVRHLPEVTIFPQTKSIMLHEQVELTCTADAFPEINNFTWTCFPEGVLKGCGITSSSRHSFTLDKTGLCMSQVHGVHITCSAINSEGKGTGYAHLDIVKDTANACNNNYTIYQEKGILSSRVDVNISIYQKLLTENFALMCVISGNPMAYSVHFEWYIDDAPVTNDHRFLVQTIHLMSTFTISTNFQRPELIQTFTCEATIGGWTDIISTNLSSLLKKKKQISLFASARKESFNCVEVTQFSNYEDISLDEQLKEYTTDKTATSVKSKTKSQSRLDKNGPMINPFTMMVLSGVALLLAFIMIIISLSMCIVNKKQRKEMDPSIYSHAQQPRTMITHTSPEYCTNIEMTDGPFYEVPNDQSAYTTPTCFVINSSSSTIDTSNTGKQTLNHDYFTGDSPKISWSNAGESNSSSYDGSFLQQDYTSATHDSLYVNK